MIICQFHSKLSTATNLARGANLEETTEEKMSVGFTQTDGYGYCNSRWCDTKLNDTSRPWEYCFCPGCGFEKDDPDEKFCTGCDKDCGEHSQ